MCKCNWMILKSQMLYIYFFRTMMRTARFNGIELEYVYFAPLGKAQQKKYSPINSTILKRSYRKKCIATSLNASNTCLIYIGRIRDTFFMEKCKCTQLICARYSCSCFYCTHQHSVMFMRAVYLLAVNVLNVFSLKVYVAFCAGFSCDSTFYNFVREITRNICCFSPFHMAYVICVCVCVYFVAGLN